MVKTVRWESGNITTQTGQNDNGNPEVIAFVVNTGMNFTAKIVMFEYRKDAVLSDVFAFLD